MSLAIGLTLLRIVTGLFFVVTGARKVFVPEVRTQVMGMLARNGVPVPAASVAIAAEFLGGLALTAGFLTHLAAAGLVIVMVGAYVIGAWPEVKAKQAWVPRYPRRVSPHADGGPLTVSLGHCSICAEIYGLRPASYSKLVSNALCTPEAQLLLIVAALAFMGAGPLSLDSLLF